MSKRLVSSSKSAVHFSSDTLKKNLLKIIEWANTTKKKESNLTEQQSSLIVSETKLSQEKANLAEKGQKDKDKDISSPPTK